MGPKPPFSLQRGGHRVAPSSIFKAPIYYCFVWESELQDLRAGCIRLKVRLILQAAQRHRSYRRKPDDP